MMNENDFYLLARKDNVRGLLLKLESGMNVDFQNEAGETALYTASYFGSKKCVEALISFGANINLYDTFGRTPLHVSAYNKHIEIFCKLLINKAKTDIFDSQGNMPMEIALHYFKIDEIILNLKHLNVKYSESSRIINNSLPKQAVVNIFPRKQLFKRSMEMFPLCQCIAHIEETQLVRTCTVPATISYNLMLCLESMNWNYTPVSLQTLKIISDKSGQYEKQSLSFKKQFEVDKKWLCQLRHANILQVLGKTFSSSIECLVFERVYIGCLYDILYQKHKEELCTLTGLTICRQILEALIFLHQKNLVHCTISSHCIYLVNPDLAKLGNFEFVQQLSDQTESKDFCGLHDFTPKVIKEMEPELLCSVQNMSENEVVRLAPWLAPEIVVFMRGSHLENASINLSVVGTSGYEQCVTSFPSLGTDVYGFSRVLQELFDNDCSRRFNPNKIHGSTFQIHDDSHCRLHERKYTLSQLRPLMKQAFKSDPTMRPSVKNLHSMIVQNFWDLHDKQRGGGRHTCASQNTRQWRESLFMHSKTKTQNAFPPGKLELSSLTNENGSLSPGLQTVELQNSLLRQKVHRTFPKPEVFSDINYARDASTNLQKYSRDKQSVLDYNNKENLKPFTRATHQPNDSDTSRSHLRAVLIPNLISEEKPKLQTNTYHCKPLDFSSPISHDIAVTHPENTIIRKPLPQLNSTYPQSYEKTDSSNEFSLTKETYLQMAAIPCEPLGNGKSRSAVPWMVPSAPRPNSPSECSIHSLSSAGRNRLKNATIDHTGNWWKTEDQTNNKQTHRKIWSDMSRRFQKRSTKLHTFMPPIKPASHLINPPIMFACQNGSINKFGRYLPKTNEHIFSSFLTENSSNCFMLSSKMQTSRTKAPINPHCTSSTNSKTVVLVEIDETDIFKKTILSPQKTTPLLKPTLNRTVTPTKDWTATDSSPKFKELDGESMHKMKNSISKKTANARAAFFSPELTESDNREWSSERLLLHQSSSVNELDEKKRQIRKEAQLTSSFDDLSKVRHKLAEIYVKKLR